MKELHAELGRKEIEIRRNLHLGPISDLVRGETTLKMAQEKPLETAETRKETEAKQEATQRVSRSLLLSRELTLYLRKKFVLTIGNRKVFIESDHPRIQTAS